MYGELAAACAFIFGGTAAFTVYAEGDETAASAWIIPFVLLALAVILSAYALRKHVSRIRTTKKCDDAPPEEFDAVVAGAIWIGWMTYGMVFSKVVPIFGGVLAYIHGSTVVALVLLTHTRAHVRREGAWANGLLIVVAALLFLPHPDTISWHLPPTILYTKVGVFYVLYCVSEVAQKLELEARARVGDIATPAERIYAVQIQVVQTAWVLLSVFPMVLLALAQIGLLASEIRAQLALRRADANASALPLVHAAQARVQVAAQREVPADNAPPQAAQPHPRVVVAAAAAAAAVISFPRSADARAAIRSANDALFDVAPPRARPRVRNG